MAIQRSVLLIADIGGYTRFMNTHRMALSHAQETVAALLEAVIDASVPLKVAKLEGDAAFLYAPAKNNASQALALAVSQMRQAFLARQQEMVVNRMCSCQGCVGTQDLSLKFVAHVGDVAFQKVKQFTELAGVDVILVHRMLKNAVPKREYMLMTDGVLQGLEPNFAKHAHPIAHDFEGIGPTQTHFIDLTEVAAPPPPASPQSYLLRLWRMFAMTAKGMPYFLGFKEPCGTFHNVDKVAELVPGMSAS